MESQCSATSPLDLEDIEDLIHNAPDTNKANAKSRLVVPKVKKKNPRLPTINCHSNEDDDENDCDNRNSESTSFLPGQAKVFVKTWGCSHNVSDGEYMAGQLAAQGYEYGNFVSPCCHQGFNSFCLFAESSTTQAVQTCGF